MIAYCTCKHAFQDTRYGEGKRVHNPVKAKNKPANTWRCTVCRTERVITQ